jgi:hypothetical protein
MSTDVNTSQHISTRPNTDKETPIYGICIFVRKGAGKAVCVWGIWQPETKKQLQMVSIQNRFSD